MIPLINTGRDEIITALAEAFREHGYAGASLALLGRATKLGKGSLYHFFPGGKEEMLASVLSEIDTWFESNIFAPLNSESDAVVAIDAMFDRVENYFRSGRRVCLVGVLALSDDRDRFALPVQTYFTRWIEALCRALTGAGWSRPEAAMRAEDVVAGIQGAIVLARALDNPSVFSRSILRLRVRSCRCLEPSRLVEHHTSS